MYSGSHKITLPPGIVNIESAFERSEQKRGVGKRGVPLDKGQIPEYIKIFYNRQRKQAKLGFLSPAVYEQQFYQKQLAA